MTGMAVILAEPYIGITPYIGPLCIIKLWCVSVTFVDYTPMLPETITVIAKISIYIYIQCVFLSF